MFSIIPTFTICLIIILNALYLIMSSIGYSSNPEYALFGKYNSILLFSNIITKFNNWLDK